MCSLNLVPPMYMYIYQRSGRVPDIVLVALCYLGVCVVKYIYPNGIRPE